MTIRASGMHRYDDRDYSRGYRPEWRNYDYRRFEPGQRRYDASRYYIRDDRRYGTRRLYENDRIYRGYDDRYYCRRDDGTTGLIVGGIAGGVLGHILAPGGSKTLGTIIGAGAGGLIGREIDRGDVVCH
jgi:Glycine zipper 2TM domain